MADAWSGADGQGRKIPCSKCRRWAKLQDSLQFWKVPNEVFGKIAGRWAVLIILPVRWARFLQGELEFWPRRNPSARRLEILATRASPRTALRSRTPANAPRTPHGTAARARAATDTVTMVSKCMNKPFNAGFRIRESAPAAAHRAVHGRLLIFSRSVWLYAYSIQRCDGMYTPSRAFKAVHIRSAQGFHRDFAPQSTFGLMHCRFRSAAEYTFRNSEQMGAGDPANVAILLNI